MAPATAERERLVRRTTRLLLGAQVALWGAIGVFAAFGAIGMTELSELEGGAAVLFGLYYAAAAPAAVVTGRVMDRVGRRPGLVGGYLVLIASGVVAFAAVTLGSAGLLLVAGVVEGAGVGAALLGRAAVADMHPPERRGRAVGLLIVAGTIGAVGGPQLGGAIHALAGRLSLVERDAAPWLLVPLLGLVGLACVLSLRPDPRDLAVEAARSSGVRRPAEILRLRPATVAAVTIGVVQICMVTFMSVLPSVLHRHGSGELTVTAVVSLHLGGMFALAPLLGAALDRWGRRPGLVAAVLLAMAGVAIVTFADGAVVPGAGLFLIGVGWSAGYLGSTAVVSDLSAPAERASALGLTDLVAGLAAAIGVLGGAVLLEATGLFTLGFAALALLLVPLLLLLALRERTPEPAVEARAICPLV